MREAEAEERFRNVKIVFEKLLRDIEKQKEKPIDKQIPIEPECNT